MPPEETKPTEMPPPVQEAPSPVPESPVTEPAQITPPPTPVPQSPAPEPVQSAPEPSSAPAESVPTPLGAPTEPQTAQPEPPFEQPQDKPTAQVPVNEPIAPKPEPIPEPPPPPAPQAQVPVPVFAPVLNLIRNLAVKARAVIQSRKRKKLERIMEVVNAKGKITNDQVEKLLHVSDATATRYLSQLEKEGKVKQEGKTGKGVSYLKI